MCGYYGCIFRSKVYISSTVFMFTQKVLFRKTFHFLQPTHKMGIRILFVLAGEELEMPHVEAQEVNTVTTTSNGGPVWGFGGEEPRNQVTPKCILVLMSMCILLL